MNCRNRFDANGRKASCRRCGFSLVEALVATTVVGIGLTAILASVASGTRTNAAAKDITYGVFLAQGVREWTLRLPFSDTDPGDQGHPPGPDGTDPQTFVDDLDDLMNVTYCPPRDGQGNPIADMTDWSETFTLTWRDPDALTTTVSPGASDVIHVQLDILHQGRPVLDTGWFVTRRE